MSTTFSPGDTDCRLTEGSSPTKSETPLKPLASSAAGETTEIAMGIFCTDSSPTREALTTISCNARLSPAAGVSAREATGQRAAADSRSEAAALAARTRMDTGGLSSICRSLLS